MKDTQPTKLDGLTTAEVQHARQQYGNNEITPEKRQNIFQRIWSVIKEPMFLLLIAAALVYLLIGKPSDAIIMLVSIFLTLGLDFLQTEKTNQAIKELKQLSAINVTVVRGGKTKLVDSKDVVVGDIVLLKEGDKIPADGQILFLQSLGVNESTLTGESTTVYKVIHPAHNEHFKLDYCYAGTYVVNGSATIQITAVGDQTELGKIGHSFANIKTPRTPLMQQFNKITKICAVISISTCALVAIVTFINSQEVDTMARLSQAILAGITIAISAIPEEIPLVVTIFLALGAQKLAHQNTLTRNMKAIENLGTITTLCTDKTGTLTKNQMSVADEYHTHDHFYRAAYLACPPQAFDPTDIAVKKYCETHVNKGEKSNKLVKEYPFTAKTKMVGQVWHLNHGQHLLCVKGAFETVLPLCKLTPTVKKQIAEQAHQFSEQGYRVLAVAEVTTSHNLPTSLQHAPKLQFLGLIALVDPVRSGIYDSIQRCKTAGVRVIMITGDNGETARGIAKQLQIDHTDQVLTGIELEKMSDHELQQKVKTINIFSRVYPNHKTRIIKALQKNKEVVAMTGDGVNDAPALKQADIGIAMGKRGTSVAAEASDLILLDDNFNTIVNAIEQGRTIYRNIKKAVAYIFALHTPIILLALMVPLFSWPTLLLPVHIVLLELLIDPTCSIIFQRLKPKHDLMQDPPRDLKQPVMTKTEVARYIAQGVLIFIIIFATYGWLLACNVTVNLAGTITYVALVFSLIFLSYQMQSSRSTLTNLISGLKDSVAIGINLTIIIILCFVIYLPFFNQTANTTALGWQGWLAAIILALVATVPFDLLKLRRRTLKKH